MIEEELNEEEMAIQKIKEELQNEDGIDKIIGCEKCDICQHPGFAEANTVYYDNKKSLDIVRLWFKNKYSIKFSIKELKIHFEEHVEPFVSSFSILRTTKLEKLKKQATSIKDTAHKIPMIMEMILQRMFDIYVTEDNTSDSGYDKEEHRKSSKEVAELAKVYKEYYQMNIEIMGIGKTPEEQIQAVQDCFKDMVEKFSDFFSDEPEVQKKFDEFMKNLK